MRVTIYDKDDTIVGVMDTESIIDIEANTPIGGRFVEGGFLLPLNTTIQKFLTKLSNVNKIKITQLDNTFDCSEDSQNRMIRAIFAAEHNNETSIQWRMLDNTIKQIPISDFKSILSKAVIETSKIILEYQK